MVKIWSYCPPLSSLNKQLLKSLHIWFNLIISDVNFSFFILVLQHLNGYPAPAAGQSVPEVSTSLSDETQAASQSATNPVVPPQSTSQDSSGYMLTPNAPSLYAHSLGPFEKPPPYACWKTWTLTSDRHLTPVTSTAAAANDLRKSLCNVTYSCSKCDRCCCLVVSKTSKRSSSFGGVFIVWFIESYKAETLKNASHPQLRHTDHCILCLRFLLRTLKCWHYSDSWITRVV